MNPHELKQLQVSFAKAKAELEAADRELQEYQKRVSSLARRCQELERAMAKQTEAGIHVTEHALLRYAERCMGMDVAQVTDLLKSIAGALGDGKYPLPDGHKAVVKNNTIVTVE